MWNSENDVGDPPVVGYVVYYKAPRTESWSNSSMIICSETLQYTQTGLQEETHYTFTVSAVRDGEMGVGPMGPPVMKNTSGK